MFEEIIEKVAELSADCYLTFDTAEVFYLSGFRTTHGACALLSSGACLFYTDARYIELARREVKHLDVLPWKGWKAFIKSLKENGVSTVVVSPEKVKLSFYRKLSAEFTVVEEEGFLDTFRAVKSEKELCLITKAVHIAEQALRSVLHLLKPGTTEEAFRRHLVTAMMRLGGEGEAFPTIVASGKASAVPHWKTSGKEIKSGDVVVVDFGTVYRGYVSDITRTFLIGSVPSELAKVYEVVMSAQELGVRALKSGAIAGDVDRLTKDYISRHGYEEFVLHSTGHGIGIEVHESPRLSADSTETLKKGMVVTVEPGIYIPELGGVRIEDDCLVLEDGGWRISHI